jgi:hypothetical protein
MCHGCKSLAECITGGAVILTERLIGPAGDVAFTAAFTGTIAIPVAFEPGGGRGIGLAGAAGITATPSIVARIVDDRVSANVNLANIHAVARTSPTHLFEQIKMGALRIAPESHQNRTRIARQSNDTHRSRSQV